VEASQRSDGKPDEVMATALLGAIESPKLKLFEHVEERATQDNRLKKQLADESVAFATLACREQSYRGSGEGYRGHRCRVGRGAGS